MQVYSFNKLDTYHAENICSVSELHVYHTYKTGYPIYTHGTAWIALNLGTLLGKAIGRYIKEKFGQFSDIECNIIFTGSSGTFLAASALPSIKETLLEEYEELGESIFNEVAKKIRLVYIPKPTEKRHDNLSYVDFNEGLNLIIDDLIDSGATVHRIIKTIADLGGSNINPIDAVFCEWMDSSVNESVKCEGEELERIVKYQIQDLKIFTLK